MTIKEAIFIIKFHYSTAHDIIMHKAYGNYLYMYCNVQPRHAAVLSTPSGVSCGFG